MRLERQQLEAQVAEADIATAARSKHRLIDDPAICSSGDDDSWRQRLRCRGVTQSRGQPDAVLTRGQLEEICCGGNCGFEEVRPVVEARVDPAAAQSNW